MPQLPTGVIEQFLHPPLSVLTRELIPGTFTGSGVLTRARGPIPVDAFGILPTFFTIPAGFGFTLGTPNVYEDRIVQISVEHTLLDGHSVFSQVEEVFVDGIPILFDVALPTQINYFITPSCVLTFQWLLAL